MIQPHGSPIVMTVTRLLQPWLWLFAGYVLLHGHDSPGGGFQAGVALAGSVILDTIVFGDRGARYQTIRRLAPELAALGVSLYAGIGFLGLAGGNFLDYSRLPIPSSEPFRRWLGILGVETGVCLGVMASLVLIFDRLTSASLSRSPHD